MFDRRLEAIIASAETGSFTQAAQRLNISVPALVKQVSTYEAENDITLFDRSHTGVSLTQAGVLFVPEARAAMKRSREVLGRARAATTEQSVVRLGVSLMCPGKNTLALWPRIAELEPGLRLEIVTVSDLYDIRGSVMTRLGDEVDVVQSSYSTVRWGGTCKLLPFFSVPFAVDVPRGSRLSECERVEFSDLRGMTVRILRYGNDAMDRLRDILEGVRGVTVMDVNRFDFALFNEAEEHGDAVLTCGAWSGLHPGFVSVPLSCGFEVPCFLAYAPRPTPQVERFVAALERVLEE